LDVELPLLIWFDKIILSDKAFSLGGWILDTLKQILKKYWKIREEENKIFLSLKVWRIIEFVTLSYGEDDYDSDLPIWFLLTYLKHPMNKELFEIEWVRKNLSFPFYFHDDRKKIKEEEIENHWGKWVWSNVFYFDSDSILEYKTPWKKPDRF
jgi:hypothetical protein